MTTEETPHYRAEEPRTSDTNPFMTEEEVYRFLLEKKEEAKALLRHPVVRPIITECHLLRETLLEHGVQRRVQLQEQRALLLAEEGAGRAKIMASYYETTLALSQAHLLHPWTIVGSALYKEKEELWTENEELQGRMELAGELLPFSGTVERRLSGLEEHSGHRPEVTPRRSFIEIDSNRISPSTTQKRKRRRDSVVEVDDDRKHSDNENILKSTKKSPAEITKMRKTIHRDDIVTSIK
ncbi:hypothetical protein ADEAN_000799100 [Angomonas deanei]|uniref:Uncharacterized protein n=1 Tax=Angomonas deanei TaxID=59799 RepID=A0A7G2CM13_9TRYP|nr:hypothetical protein ADEAN_000799100 [Angomonas deanei]